MKKASKRQKRSVAFESDNDSDSDDNEFMRNAPIINNGDKSKSKGGRSNDEKCKNENNDDSDDDIPRIPQNTLCAYRT
eukprot:5062383-Ditylum_brightwellii.AAC.1